MRTNIIKTGKLANPIQGLGLVAEGGGQRGAFTAGVLDAWQLAQFNPFQILVGTSAGAQNIASYMSQQCGYAFSLISDLTKQDSFYNPWRIFSQSKNIMDLDWYFSQTKTHRYKFDFSSANKNTLGREVRFSTVKTRTNETALLNPSKVGWLEGLKYSSAIPFLYKSSGYIDGGVNAPVPIKEAYELGATTIVAIRTRINNSKIVPTPVKRIKPFLCPKGRCPKAISLLEQHEKAYEKMEQFVSAPPKKTKVIEIKPERPLKSQALGSSKEDIVSDYRQGLHIGSKFLTNNTGLLHQVN